LRYVIAYTLSLRRLVLLYSLGLGYISLSYRVVILAFFFFSVLELDETLLSLLVLPLALAFMGFYTKPAIILAPESILVRYFAFV